MMQERFEYLLKQAIGLDTNSIGASAVTRAVETRARACRIADLQIYWDRISEDSAELQALIETVVVPETWFYRDREAFAAAAALLRDELRSRPASPFRLLSLPCSTGEEPFTMAMALIDAGVPPSAFRVDGIDISNRALQRARAGVYGRNSFRGSGLAYRDRHFADTGRGHRISDTVRGSVHFSQGNLFELDKLADGSFDVIFCRNLLIYFDPADQRRAAGVLRRLLAPQGTLFIGHSEASLLLGEGFASLRIPYAFAFRKQEHIEKFAPPAPPRRSVKNRPAAPPPAKRPGAGRSSPKAAVRIIQVPAAPGSAGGLEDIRRAADRGEVDVALQLGRVMLKEGEPTPDALHLLAVINEAAGDTAAAVDCYRKTLYLDPNHHEALIHLALLMERLGDGAGAKRMRDRARRLDERRAG